MGKPIKPLVVWIVGIAAVIVLAFFFNVGGMQDFYFGSRYFRPYARLSQEIRGNLVVRLNDDRILLLNANRSEIFNPKTRLSEFAEGLDSVKVFAQNLNLLALSDNNVLITHAGVYSNGDLKCESPNGIHQNPRYCPIDKTLLFNIKTNKIEWIPYPLRYLEGQKNILLPDGNVLIIGGRVPYYGKEAYKTLFPGKEYSNNNIVLYNPTNYTYKVLGKLIIPRYNHNAVLINEKEVMIIGGSEDDRQVPSLSNQKPVYQIEIFNLETGISRIVGTQKLDGSAIVPLDHQRYLVPFGNWREGKIYSEILDLEDINNSVVIEGESPRKRFEGVGPCALLPNRKVICIGTTEAREIDTEERTVRLIDSVCTQPLYMIFPIYIPDVGLLVFGNAIHFKRDERTVQIFNYERYLKDLKARENRPSP